VEFGLPTKMKVLKWILGVLGALVISALGSGVWQSLLGPAIHSSSRWVMDVASLGLASYKNGVYQQIAADNPSAIDIEMLSWLTFMSALALGIVSGASAAKRSNTSDGVKVGKTSRIVVHVTPLFLIFMLVNQAASVSRLSYVSSADAHYHYVMRVASPYLDAGEKAEVESDFAEISSREDYVRLLSTLEGKCKAKGRPLTTFYPW
jgi:hypothetical protein